jgi:hypothetical protein
MHFDVEEEERVSSSHFGGLDEVSPNYSTFL